MYSMLIDGVRHSVSDCVSWQWPPQGGLTSGSVFGASILGVSRCSYLSGCWGSAGPRGHLGRWCVSSGLQRSSRSEDMKQRHGHVDNPVLMFTLFTAAFICVWWGYSESLWTECAPLTTLWSAVISLVSPLKKVTLTVCPSAETSFLVPLGKTIRRSPPARTFSTWRKKNQSSVSCLLHNY